MTYKVKIDNLENCSVISSDNLGVLIRLSSHCPADWNCMLGNYVLVTRPISKTDLQECVNNVLNPSTVEVE
jgi:hypothetical protein